MNPPALRRALPASAVDLIREGVPDRDLRAGGDRAVWRALVSTAASASQRGWTYAEWNALIAERQSQLGTQASFQRGRYRGIPHKTLLKAWTDAERWVASKPLPITAPEAKALAASVRSWGSSGKTGLSVPQQAILLFATEVAERNGTTRPALPRREVMAATGLGERTVRTALRQLEQLGLLRLAVAGRPGGPSSQKRRANLYTLPSGEDITAYLSRETRPVGQGAQTYGTHGDGGLGTMAQVYGTRPQGRAVRGLRSTRVLCPVNGSGPPSDQIQRAG